MKAKYSVERHEHGWLFCAAPMERGIPMDALSECMKLFKKEAVMNGQIATSFNRQGYHTKAVMAVGIAKGLSLWEDEINARLKDRPAEERWWYGTDTGQSSCAMFRVLCSPHLKGRAAEYSPGSVPQDADDFGRCQRLIDAVPEWRERLIEVAIAYPETKWPSIVTRWDEIAAAAVEHQTAILQAL